MLVKQPLAAAGNSAMHKSRQLVTALHDSDATETIDSLTFYYKDVTISELDDYTKAVVALTNDYGGGSNAILGIVPVLIGNTTLRIYKCKPTTQRTINAEIYEFTDDWTINHTLLTMPGNAAGDTVAEADVSIDTSKERLCFGAVGLANSNPYSWPAIWYNQATGKVRMQRNWGADGAVAMGSLYIAISPNDLAGA